MSTKVAQFKGTGQYGVTIIIGLKDGEEDQYPLEGYVRISKWVDVTFEPRSREETVMAEISALDEERAEIVGEFSRRLKDIDIRKAELLAITHEVEPA